MDELVKKTDLLVKYHLILDGYDSDVSALSLKVNEQIEEMKKGIETLRKQLDEQKTQITKCKEISETLKGAEKRMSHIMNELPDRYCYISNSSEIEPLKVEEEEFPLVSPIPGTPMLWNDLSPDSAEQTRRHTKMVSHSSISYLSCEEFDSVPKYMKGRITYETINRFIDSVNTTLQKKYQIFGRPRETLRGKLLKTYDTFKQQETKETIHKGIYFCTAEDMKNYANIKLDKTTINIINILRGAQRIREIRTPGLVRYAVFHQGMDI